MCPGMFPPPVIFHLNAGSAMNYILPEFHICNLCGKGGHKETICRTKPKFRENVTQMAEPTVSQVTKPMASSKKQMKQNENPHKNFHERVTETRRKRGRKRNQHPELVPTIDNGSKRSVLFQAFEAKSPNQEKGKEQIPRKMGGSNDVKSEGCSRELLDGCLSKI
ncbi:hypothetical protein ACTXT7_012602 [Hymenolepis weldensis]